MGELDGVISDPDGFERIQLEAMRVLIGTVRMCYRIVKDVSVERLERELEMIREDDREARERGELGYTVED
jgi:uncharacterized Fe-S cluster-containing radical SAM superfamily protein